MDRLTGMRVIACVLVLCLAAACLACGCGAEQQTAPKAEVQTEIPAGAHKRATIESFEIAEGVQVIGDGAFEDCRYLRSVTIPDTVTEIGARAFQGCTALEKIELPDSVVRIGENAFAKCSALRTVTFSASLLHISDGAFSDCDALTAIVLPEGLKTVGKDAFADCGELKSATLPASLYSIGDTAFCRCRKLETVTLSGGASIGASAFAFCDSLTEVTLPNTLSVICEKAFFADTGLSDIAMPDMLSTLGDDAFAGTALLTGADAFVHAGFADAKEDLGKEPLVAEGQTVRIIPLDENGAIIGELFCRMPASIRTIDSREADYALVRTTENEARSDYYGMAFDRLTYVFFCAKDGTATKIFFERSAPPIHGEGVGYGEIASGAAIWSEIGDRFPN